MISEGSCDTEDWSDDLTLPLQELITLNKKIEIENF